MNCRFRTLSATGCSGSLIVASLKRLRGRARRPSSCIQTGTGPQGTSQSGSEAGHEKFKRTDDDFEEAAQTPSFPKAGRRIGVWTHPAVWYEFELERCAGEQRVLAPRSKDYSGDPVEDEILNCVDCAQPFVFTASERQFYIDKQFVDHEGRVILPIRCEACRRSRKQWRRQSVDSALLVGNK